MVSQGNFSDLTWPSKPPLPQSRQYGRDSSNRHSPARHRWLRRALAIVLVLAVCTRVDARPISSLDDKPSQRFARQVFTSSPSGSSTAAPSVNQPTQSPSLTPSHRPTKSPSGTPTTIPTSVSSPDTYPNATTVSITSSTSANSVSSVRPTADRYQFGDIFDLAQDGSIHFRLGQGRCAEGQLECETGSQCISFNGRCDGTVNCDDGSDEHECDPVGFVASSMGFYIAVGFVIVVPAVIIIFVTIICRKRYAALAEVKTELPFVPFDAMGITAETCVDCQSVAAHPIPTVNGAYAVVPDSLERGWYCNNCWIATHGENWVDAVPKEICVDCHEVTPNPEPCINGAFAERGWYCSLCWISTAGNEWVEVAKKYGPNRKRASAWQLRCHDCRHLLDPEFKNREVIHFHEDFILYCEYCWDRAFGSHCRPGVGEYRIRRLSEPSPSIKLEIKRLTKVKAKSASKIDPQSIFDAEYPNSTNALAHFHPIAHDSLAAASIIPFDEEGTADELYERLHEYYQRHAPTAKTDEQIRKSAEKMAVHGTTTKNAKLWKKYGESFDKFAKQRRISLRNRSVVSPDAMLADRIAKQEEERRNQAVDIALADCDLDAHIEAMIAAHEAELMLADRGEAPSDPALVAHVAQQEAMRRRQAPNIAQADRDLDILIEAQVREQEGEFEREEYLALVGEENKDLAHRLRAQKRDRDKMASSIAQADLELNDIIEAEIRQQEEELERIERGEDIDIVAMNDEDRIRAQLQRQQAMAPNVVEADRELDDIIEAQIRQQEAELERMNGSDSEEDNHDDHDAGMALASRVSEQHSRMMTSEVVEADRELDDIIEAQIRQQEAELERVDTQENDEVADLGNDAFQGRVPLRRKKSETEWAETESSSALSRRVSMQEERRMSMAVETEAADIELDKLIEARIQLQEEELNRQNMFDAGLIKTEEQVELAGVADKLDEMSPEEMEAELAKWTNNL